MEIREEYRIALEACPTPLMLVSRDGNILLSNQRFDTLFGYEAGELHEQLVDILVPDEIREFHPELRQAFFEVPASRSMGTGRDLYGRRKDGEMIPIEIGLDPKDSDGSTMVMVSVLDIRERKMGEIKIRRALDAASSAMLTIDEHGKIEMINARAGVMFGYEPKELIGQAIEKLVPERHCRKHTVYRASYQNTRDQRSMGIGRDLFGLAKDGREFPVEIGLTPLDGPEGRLVMATVIDITERKQNERNIRLKNEELQRLNAELSEFAYSASHDLKAPLSSISGILKFCQDDLAAGNLDEVRFNLDRAHGLAGRLAARIEDMLTLATSEHLDDEPEDIVVQDMVDEVWQALQGADSGVHLSTSFAHVDPFRTVPVRFHIIVENLLSNAIKFRDPRKPNPEVHVETWDRDGTFILAVRDNGIGIPAEHRDKIFVLFKRVADTHNPGNGLGLALVKKNVQHLEGAIEVESSADGSTFTVTLPRERGKAVPGDANQELEAAQ